eukprot:TRINITY_DN43943_c0_g1_i1.p1 TRINITY_DN43943_c0_g1~~TRINITY_DN43943_c0_g1_i1.p1  ORF type:complete len:162 (+),score=68.84 TRINITY_DN43943_c0_g1_i1:45-488(+)
MAEGKGKGGKGGKGDGHASSKWDGKDHKQLLCIAQTFVRDCPHVTAALNEYEQKHCDKFARHTETAEHKLEYTDVHRDYLALIEKLLSMLVSHAGASEEDFAKALSLASQEDLEAFGVLLDRSDYVSFAEHMRKKHDWWQRQAAHHK